MRILFVSYMHPAVTPGGAQQVAEELRRAAIASGHEAYMIAALEADQEGDFGKPGAPIVPMPGEENQYFYFPQHYNFTHDSVGEWRSLKFFRDLVAEIAPDVVHFHHYHRIGVESIRAARLAVPNAKIGVTFHEMMAICLNGGQMVRTTNADLCRKATPIDCHGCFPHLRPEFFTLRAARLQALFDECDFFFFPSAFIAQRYREWGLDPAKCHVIPNGQVHPAPGVDRSRHSRRLNRFGFFGQFIDNKGIDVILDAILVLAREGRLPGNGLEITINGGNRHYASEDYLAKVDALIAEIRALDDDRVRIHEFGALWARRTRRAHDDGGLGDRALDLVGGFRPGGVGGLDVRAPGDRQRHRRSGRTGEKWGQRLHFSRAQQRGARRSHREADGRRGRVAARPSSDQARLERSRHVRGACERVGRDGAKSRLRRGTRA